MVERLIIYRKLYDFVLWLYPLINRIPQSHRQILGKHVESLAISLLLLIIKANRARGPSRRVLQQNISSELDQLRILIRLTKDLRFISVKQYAFAAGKLNEIGRMLTAWIKVVC